MHVRFVRSRTLNIITDDYVVTSAKPGTSFAKLEQENVYYFSWKDSLDVWK